MNPLTQVKRTQQINLKEAALGIGEDASWHAKFKDSPYVYAGSLPFDLTEGDLLAVFSQYGEIVDVNLVRDKATGKSKGFAFVAYEDQRSTILAVDNLNGANILGRTVRVDHVSNYKKKQEEDEAMEQQKREERGVCRAFQRGNCNRGDACKFSHNEQRAANTGWGAKEDSVKGGHDRQEIPPIKSGRNVGNISGRIQESHEQEGTFNFKSNDKDKRLSSAGDDENGRKSDPKQSERNHTRRDEEKYSVKSEKEPNYRDRDKLAVQKRSGKYDSDPKSKEDWDRGLRDERPSRHESEHNRREDRSRKEEISGRHDSESNAKGDRDRKGREERSGRHDLEQNRGVDYDRRGGEKRPRYDEDSSSRRHRDEDDVQARRKRT